MTRLTVVALVGGEPGPAELWTLRRMASVACDLRVAQSGPAAAADPLKGAAALARRHGALGALSRLAAAAVGARVAAADRAALEELFDFDDLRRWWGDRALAPAQGWALNHAVLLASAAPDVIVRISGAAPRRVLSLARLAALDLSHGDPAGGMGSIRRGIVAGRRDWIGAAVRVIGGGVEPGPVLWSGGPQLAPGDTDVDLFFRAHLEATEALARILDAYARGASPRPRTAAAGEPATFRPRAGLREWLEFLRLDRGRWARVLLERGIEC